MAMRELRLSASANADFIGCQRRYYLSYVLGLEADKDKDSLRIGTQWHKCHELLEMRPEMFCPRCAKREEVDPECYICDGTGRTPTDPMDAVIRYLNREYDRCPDNKTPEEWGTEKITLLYSLSGHRWRYSGDDRWETIGSEIKFEIPLKARGMERNMRKTVFVGKIDRLVRDRNTGLVYAWERKSTGRAMDETYWQGLAQGDQVMGYIYGGRIAQAMGLLKPYGVKPEDPPIAGAMCDVWRKPSIKPKKLSKADQQTLEETNEYYGQIAEPSPDGIETPEMFGARLLADIAERPEFYFGQREVSRTDQELEEFEQRLVKIAKQMRYVEKNNLWVCSNTCTSPYYCEFLSLCRGNLAVNPDEPAPTGYRWKFGKPEPKDEEVPL